MLTLLHAAHAGINKTHDLARQLYFWPGMLEEIEQLIESVKLVAFIGRPCRRILDLPLLLPVTWGLLWLMWGRTFSTLGEENI